jgi:hypothetical protein
MLSAMNTRSSSAAFPSAQRFSQYFIRTMAFDMHVCFVSQTVFDVARDAQDAGQTLVATPRKSHRH